MEKNRDEHAAGAAAGADGANGESVAEVVLRLKAAVRQRQAEWETVPDLGEGLRGRLLELQEMEAVDEPLPVSPRPVLGRLIVFVRKVVYHLFLKWYLRTLVERDNRFRQLTVRLLSELIEERYEVERRLRRLESERRGAPDRPSDSAEEEA